MSELMVKSPAYQYERAPFFKCLKAWIYCAAKIEEWDAPEFVLIATCIIERLCVSLRANVQGLSENDRAATIRELVEAQNGTNPKTDKRSCAALWVAAVDEGGYVRGTASGTSDPSRPGEPHRALYTATVTEYGRNVFSASGTQRTKFANTTSSFAGKTRDPHRPSRGVSRRGAGHQHLEGSARTWKEFEAFASTNRLSLDETSGAIWVVEVFRDHQRKLSPQTVLQMAKNLVFHSGDLSRVRRALVKMGALGHNTLPCLFSRQRCTHQSVSSRRVPGSRSKNARSHQIALSLLEALSPSFPRHLSGGRGQIGLGIGSEAGVNLSCDGWSADLLRWGVIEADTRSRAVLALFTVLKKNSKLRLVVDGRKINRIMSHTPKMELPTIPEVQTYLRDNEWFVTVDGRSYFYQCPLGEEVREFFTANLAGTRGRFERVQLCRLPMGWSWAPAIAKGEQHTAK
eukprot:PhM_4_TR11647/c4_g3_i2/m.68124